MKLFQVLFFFVKFFSTFGANENPLLCLICMSYPFN
ncbi:hypothetical protein GLYMA_02G178850v4 [Glycine max]|nr:hypothetical protein GLYMA_02G178850v4 [Glycine max]KAH1060885.1 hypothetical protein GYH30_004385 [Glycine max]